MKRHRTTHRKKRQLNLRWIMAAALVLTGFFAWRTWTSTQQNLPARVDQESQTNPILTQSRGGRSSRAVFPYSVIPGGVGSVAELKYAVAHDPVVAAHYADFDLSKARLIRASAESQMYVSYRVGSQVYWTTKTLKIAKGETLITDGRYTSRTRCGNLVSSILARPNSPAEPNIQALDAPELPDIPLASEWPMATDEPLPPSGSPTANMVMPPPPENVPFPYPPIIYFPGGGGPADAPPAPPSPAVSVPEPDTLLLLFTGLSAVCWLRRRYQRQQWGTIRPDGRARRSSLVRVMSL